MLVTKNQIEEILQTNSIEYTYVKGSIDGDEYTVASLFEPIEGGFYFAQGNFEIPPSIVNSLLIVDDSIKQTNVNCFFQVTNVEPQLIFYKILEVLYSLHSSGIVSSLSVIHPEAVLGLNVQIDDFCVVGKCVLGDNVIIGSHSKISDDVVIGDNTIIESMACIGTKGVAWVWNHDQTEKVVQPQLGGVKIGTGCFVGTNAIIVRGSLNEKTTVGNGTLIAPSVRLGHGTKIGDFVHLANNVVTGGNVQVGDYCFIGSSVTFCPKVRIHSKTIVGAGALITKNTSESGKTLIGVPAIEIDTKQNPAGMPKPKL